MLSWGALVAARENQGPTSGAAGLLLGASRGLFPLSVGSYTRLLASLVHSQVWSAVWYAPLFVLCRISACVLACLLV